MAGHAAVVCLVGSVLAKITGGWLSASRHRVVLPEDEVSVLDHGRGRVVATFFFRPAPTALLRSPPCPDLAAGVGCSSSRKKPTTFAEWNRKVAEKYERDKGKVATLLPE